MREPLLNTDEIKQFYTGGKKIEYRRGEVVLRAGEEPRGIYFIEKGYLKVYGFSKDGNEHLHLIYGPGDLFPIIWLFEGAIRNVSYEAIRPLTVWLVEKESFLKFIKSKSTVLFSVLTHVTSLFRYYAGRIDNLLYSNSYEKVAYSIIGLVDRFGIKKGKKVIISVPLTHYDIASATSITRETASRALSRMHRKGILEYNAEHLIQINDLTSLIKIIGDDVVYGMWPELIN